MTRGKATAGSRRGRPGALAAAVGLMAVAGLVGVSGPALAGARAGALAPRADIRTSPTPGPVWTVLERARGTWPQGEREADEEIALLERGLHTRLTEADLNYRDPRWPASVERTAIPGMLRREMCWELARACYRAGDASRGHQACAQMAAAESRHSRALARYLERAMVWARSGPDYAEIAWLLESDLQLHEGDIDTVRDLARAYRNLGRYDRETAVLRRVGIMAPPGPSAAWRKELAEADVRADAPEEALSQYAAMLEALPVEAKAAATRDAARTLWEGGYRAESGRLVLARIDQPDVGADDMRLALPLLLASAQQDGTLEALRPRFAADFAAHTGSWGHAFRLARVEAMLRDQPTALAHYAIAGELAGRDVATQELVLRAIFYEQGAANDALRRGGTDVDEPAFRFVVARAPGLLALMRESGRGGEAQAGIWGMVAFAQARPGHTAAALAAWDEALEADPAHREDVARAIMQVGAHQLVGIAALDHYTRRAAADPANETYAFMARYLEHVGGGG